MGAPRLQLNNFGFRRSRSVTLHFGLEAFFMLPVVSLDSHTEFHNSFIKLFLQYYPDPFALSRQTWRTIVQFRNLDLSQTDAILADTYSKYGPEPRTPSCMLRSYLLSLKEFFRKLTAHENTVVQKYSIFSLPPLLNGVFSFFLYFYQKMFIFLLTYLPICAAVLIVHGQLRRPFDYKKHHLYP